MAVTLNASSTAGFVTTADTSTILQLQTNGTTAVTVDSSQNVGVGVTPSAWFSNNKALQVGTAFLQADGFGLGSVGYGRNAYQASGGWVYRANGYANMLNIETDGAYKFFNAPSGTAGNAITFTQAMTLDSSGNLLVGTTTASGKFTVSAITTPLYSSNTNGTSGDYSAIFALGANSNNTSSVFLLCTNPGVSNRFVIYGNGTYATVSDQRLKKNIETTRDGYLDDLMNLRVVKYNWTSQEDGEPKELGVIAQEIEQVFPSLVQESLAEGADTAYKQVKTSVLPFMLLKALQEQQAIIESLTQRITALEGAQP